MVDLRDWRNLDERRSALHDAAQTLANGQLVAFALETGYAVAACGLLPAAVHQLVEASATASDVRAALLLGSPSAFTDWAPDLSAAAVRLSRRCWPGPVQFVLRIDSGGGVASRLNPEVRGAVGPDGDLHFRVPAHEAIRQASRLLPGFLVVADAEIGAAANGTAAERLHNRYRERLGMVIDDGPPLYDRPATVVRLEQNGWQLVREGAVSADALRELSARMIVFVCTGNTCRSPLAAALCQKLLAERCSCSADELPRRGFIASSAGLSAVPGCSAAPETIAIAKEYGVDLGGHTTRPLSAMLLRQADYVFAMTASHLRAMAMHLPGAGPAMHVLSPRGEDIPDPIGGDDATYKQCAEQIWQCLQDRLTEILGE